MKKIVTFGIILAAGKGSRMECNKVNKTSLSFAGKPLIIYAVDALDQINEQIFVVIGSFANSVKEKITQFFPLSKKISFILQKKRLGTGHALKVAYQQIKKMSQHPDYLFLGYGDHMMFYKQPTFKKLLKSCYQNKASLSLVTTIVTNPNGMGRIMRDNNNNFVKIIEEKNANINEKKIKEINAGLYCLNWSFLTKNLNKIKKNKISGEYYVTDLVEIAQKQNLIIKTVQIDYSEVGIGINTKEELSQSQALFKIIQQQ